MHRRRGRRSCAPTFVDQLHLSSSVQVPPRHLAHLRPTPQPVLRLPPPPPPQVVVHAIVAFLPDHRIRQRKCCRSSVGIALKHRPPPLPPLCVRQPPPLCMALCRTPVTGPGGSGGLTPPRRLRHHRSSGGRLAAKRINTKAGRHRSTARRLAHAQEAALGPSSFPPPPSAPLLPPI